MDEIKQPKKKIKKNERALVRKFIDRYHKEHYVYIDADSPFRVRKSGFDFFVLRQGYVCFYEAKYVEQKEKYVTGQRPPFYRDEAKKLLSAFQKLEAQKILLHGGKYFILVFVKFACGTLKFYEFSLHDLTSLPTHESEF